MQFPKPHLNYQEQVQLLASRGLALGSEREAVAALKRIGYYRLSAYTYPMRVALPITKSGARPRRADDFVEGAQLADAVRLHDFDQKLRRIVLSATQSLEVGLRTHVAYRLSRHDPIGHLTKVGLDDKVCSELNRGPDHLGTRYESWHREYVQLQGKAREEEYVRHFTENYDGLVPIWAASEFMTMGCLIALYKLLEPKDARRIAEDLGVKNPNVLHGWLKALNVLRNHCAHNARIWNRHTVYPPTINRRMVGSGLHHLEGADNHKVYFMLAVLAYLLNRVDPSSRFVSEIQTEMKKFPPVLGMTPENTMGFTEDWKKEQLWRSAH